MTTKNKQASTAMPRLIKFQIGVSLVALLILLGVLFELGPLIEEKARLEKETQRLSEQIQQDTQNLQLIENQTLQMQQQFAAVQAKLAQANQQLSDIYNPPLDAIKPQAEKTEIDQELFTQLGSKFYNFSIWLDTPGLMGEKIERVEYFFDNPTFSRKRMTSRDRSNAFAISYVGYSCLTTVGITVFFKDQSTHEIDFEFCSALAPDNMPT